MVGSDGRPPPAPPCLAPVHLQLPTCTASNAYLHQDLLPPSFPRSFSPRALDSFELFFRRLRACRWSRWKTLYERVALISRLPPAASRRATKGLAEPPTTRSRTERNLYTPGNRKKKRSEVEESAGRVASARPPTLPRRASRAINHGRVLRFCRASRPTCVPRAPLFRV